MTKMKFCGLSRVEDIEAANEIGPDYVGFVFVPGSKRYVTPEQARSLKSLLRPGIVAVGVFGQEKVEVVAKLLEEGTIDVCQLHGGEDAAYRRDLRVLTSKPIVQAFLVRSEADVLAAECCDADYILLDSGAGSGKVFDWTLVRKVKRPYFLAGGLTSEQVAGALTELSPYALDVSSGIETDGRKDREKMRAFAARVREESGRK